MSVPQEQMVEHFHAMKRPPLTAMDFGYFALIALGAIGIWQYYAEFMDRYEIGVLALAAVGIGFLGWLWKPTRVLTVVVAALAVLALWRYSTHLPEGVTELSRAGLAQAQESDFLLKYFLSSQSAIMWMIALYLMATPVYFAGLIRGSDYLNRVGTALTWIATTMGLVGLLARWRETYLISFDYGYIPVSNLYEVFVLFAIITAMMYLFYEKRAGNRNLGGFVLTVISAAMLFLLWYVFTREAQTIEPLVPALQSWWMKIHVPSNFVGYGGFAIAAMIGVAYLIKLKMGGDGPNDRLPSLAVMDDIMYKVVAIGWAFFTIATILGAMWAAEAWGGYWSWDPKETWALIVWLNYAAWLHLRLTKGWTGAVMAWWAIVGLFITTFAFLGVNIFLSGLHSYGEL
ncbi:MAG: c-type cytochrome biogenesis protein CcsB [Halothiobacillaceae bacterium]